MEKNTQDKIKELQMLEQNLQGVTMQRQNFQSRLLEVENATQELSNKPEEVYKIIGQIMVKTKIEDVEKDLGSKKEIFELKVKTSEKNENKIKDKAKEIQEAIMKELKDE